MASQIKTLPGSKVELTITVPYEDYKKAEARALEKIGKELKVDGFRPGNIPENVIREKVDAKTIIQFAMEEALPLSYMAAVKEHDVQVISRPKIEVRTPVENEGDSLVYIATVAVMPEVELGDYKKIKVQREEVKVEEKQIDETIAMIMERFAEWQDVDRAAQKGDRVEADFTGYDQEGKEIPNTASKNHPIILGQGTMIPGFEEAITGMSKDDEKEFDITFPEKYHAAQMQGKKVKFKLKVGRVEERKAQTLDEALVEKVTGQKQSPEAFREMVKVDLKSEMDMRAQATHDNKVVGEIIKVVKVDLPQELIDDEVEQMKEEQKMRVKQQGLTWEQYLTHIKKGEEEFAKDHLEAAKSRLTARLGVNQIIKESGITVADDEVDAKLNEIISRYPAEEQNKVREHYKNGSEAYASLKNNMAADKLIAMFTV